MSYAAKTDLKGMVKDEQVLLALDDDGDGVEDPGVWDAIAAQADEEIDGRLERRFATPIRPPYPSVVSLAAKIFCAERLWDRRGLSEETANPWKRQANELRGLLDRIGAGDAPLSVNVDELDNPAAITEPMRTRSACGALMA